MHATNRKDIQTIPNNLLDIFENDIDLTTNFQMIPDMIKTAFTNDIRVITVTNVQTIFSAIQSNIYKEMLSEVDELLNLFLLSSNHYYNRTLFFIVM